MTCPRNHWEWDGESRNQTTATDQKYNPKLQYLVVNEAGASVYSASKREEEFPDLDVSIRAVSIASYKIPGGAGKSDLNPLEWGSTSMT